MMEVESSVDPVHLPADADMSQCSAVSTDGCPAIPNQFSDPSTIVPPSSLTELIQRLHQIFAHDAISVEYVQRLMASYESKPQEWKKFAKFDPHRYTRNLVDEGNGKFNLMVLCWNEAQGSSIHDHANSHCFLKMLDGEVREEIFDWPEDAAKTEANGGLQKRSEAVCHKNECGYISDSIGLHRIENNSHSNKAVSLHLYSPPFSECRCFDQRTSHPTTAKMTFWSKYGKRTPFGRPPKDETAGGEDN